MISVLLADDDILTLNRLSALIDWNAFGYEVIGQSLNGADAITQVKNNQPDILILDINMPDKNGIEVTKFIKSKNFQTSILILSNYDNFEFVRDAMKFGAHDYCLKHQLNSNMLLQKLKEIKEHRIREGLRSSRNYYFETVAKSQYLKKLVQFGLEHSTEQKHMLTQKEFSSKSSILAVIQITNFIIMTHFFPLDNREKLIDSVINLARNIFTSLNNGIITHINQGQFVILFHFNDEVSSKKIQESAHSYMQLLLSNFHKLLNITTLYQVSDIINNVSNFKKEYKKTVTLLNRQSLNISTETHNIPPVNSIDITEEKNLVESLISMNTSEMEDILKQIFTRYSTVKDKQQLPQQIILQLLQIGKKFQQSLNTTDFQNINKEFKDKLQNKLKSKNTFEFILEYYKKIIADALAVNVSNYSLHIQNAILYIRENYKSNISIMDVAHNIHVSAAHLSRLFKKELNTSFIDYLTSYRINLAQQMIKNTNMELKKISEKVGFQNYNYFLRVYKKKLGHRPSQDIQSFRKIKMPESHHS